MNEAAAAAPPSGPARILRLALIGTAAGLFSGLFGVGGGTVIVPLLILLLGYEARAATGTSLAAIVLIAAAAAVTHEGYGNVDEGRALLVGLPAVSGVLIGTAAQQRVPQATLKIVFAALMAVTAILLLVNP
ncbi:MAG: sulfite exporter TauE/SafE family protein [Baekduia sp.]